MLPPMGEETSDQEEGWRRGLRARVTALKCHVMAAQGLTPQGRVVAAYSPDVLLNDPQNASILKQHNNPEDVAAYVAAALENTNLSNGGESVSSNGPNSTSSNKPNSTSSNKPNSTSTNGIHPSEVKLEMLPNDCSSHEISSKEEDITSSNTSKQSVYCANDVPDRPTSVQNKAMSNTTSSKDSVLNNNHKPPTDDDGCRQRWPWKASFDSDNEEDSEGHEINGYMPVSGECDEVDDVSIASGKADLNAPSASIDNNNTSTKTNLSVHDKTQIAVDDVNCPGGNPTCHCCKLHNTEKKEFLDQVQQQEKQIESLTNIRSEVENELQELTANLFQVSAEYNYIYTFCCLFISLYKYSQVL